jgi:YspA, cpYpsA-related SLOG family
VTSPEYRMLVCGSRTWNDREAMRAFLWRWLDDVTVLINGGARGVDLMAAELAHEFAEFGLPTIETYPADWDQYGKPAGIIRNGQMLDESKPDVVIAFVDKPLTSSRGTFDMVTRAMAAGVTSYVVEKKR